MHADTTEAMFYQNYDLLALHADRHLDLPRMKEGGLDAEFFSVFVHPESVDLTQFFATAVKQIDFLQATARNSAGKIAVARNADEIKENADQWACSPCSSASRAGTCSCRAAKRSSSRT